MVYESCIEINAISFAYEYELSNTTISNWFVKFRSLTLIFYVQDHSLTERVIVEINEYYVVKRKNNRGRTLKSENLAI